MSGNIKNVYDANPSTTLGNNDLLYSGAFPYGITNDTAIKYSDLLAQILNGTIIGATTPVQIRGYMPSATTINGTTYTLALADAEFFQVCSNAATQTITVPLNATIAFPVNTEIVFFQQGAGQVVFAAAGGVTIQSISSNLKISAQFGTATLKKIASDTWALFGALSA